MDEIYETYLYDRRPTHAACLLKLELGSGWRAMATTGALLLTSQLHAFSEPHYVFQQPHRHYLLQAALRLRQIPFHIPSILPELMSPGPQRSSFFPLLDIRFDFWGILFPRLTSDR